MQNSSITKLEELALSVTRGVGSIWSVIIHTLLFTGAGLLILLGVDMDRVLLVLTTIVSLEAIYLSIFIQMSVNHQARAIASVEKDIDEIQEDVQEISHDVEEIHDHVEEIQEDVEEIAEDVGEMQEDIDEIQEDVEEISHDVDEIQEDIDEIQEDVEEMQEEDYLTQIMEISPYQVQEPCFQLTQIQLRPQKLQTT
jgi:peptidoglycan hydrolase CwlO-like protein